MKNRIIWTQCEQYRYSYTDMTVKRSENCIIWSYNHEEDWKAKFRFPRQSRTMANIIWKKCFVLYIFFREMFIFGECFCIVVSGGKKRSIPKTSKNKGYSVELHRLNLYLEKVLAMIHKIQWTNRHKCVIICSGIMRYSPRNLKEVK